MSEWGRYHLTGNPKVLQNLVLADLYALDKPQWTAFCSLEGKVITTAWVEPVDAGWAIEIPIALFEVLEAHMQRYALRDPFTFTPEKLKNESRHTLLYAIENKMPYLTASTSARFTPQMLAIDAIPNAICWNKGCYLGQEVIMRIHQLGTNKRALQQFKSTKPIEDSRVIDTNQKHVGDVINFTTVENETWLIAIVPTHAKPHELLINGAPLLAF